MQQGLCQPSDFHVIAKTIAATKPDRYPIPWLRDFTQQLNKKNIFTTLDLNRAYQQIPSAKSDYRKTAISTPFGLYEFSRIFPELRYARQTF